MSSSGRTGGPLEGLRVLEFAAIGPVPFAGTFLAQMGAEVTRVERPEGLNAAIAGPVRRARQGKGCKQLDLKSKRGLAAALELVEQVDVLLEGHRPGVMERLGLGPDVCFSRNSRLVYARMTGWGQSGPISQRAGHDLNYIAATGALHAIGAAGGPPQIPLNLIGDYGGGALYLMVGVLAAIHDVQVGGAGQVIDCAMTDGVAHMLSGVHAQMESGTWRDERGVNALDGGNPTYAVYETADQRYMAVSASEPGFYRILAETLGIDCDLMLYNDPDQHRTLADQIAGAFRGRSQAEWAEIFAASDACVTPVVSLSEAPHHPHIRARGTIRVAQDGSLHAAPAPRFFRYSTVEAAHGD